MNNDIVCMDLAKVPPGEQRTKFLAVGLADNTVRVISLDPQVFTSNFFCFYYIKNVKRLCFGAGRSAKGRSGS